jgi:putative transcription antitermination factor YqgF
MNYLAVDFGYKRIGLAVSIMGIITPLPVIKNDGESIEKIKKITADYKIDGVFVGVSEGEVARDSIKFADQLSCVLQLPVETIEEAVSTIEAEEIYIRNKNKKKDYKSTIDSVAAAVILRRAVG